MTKDRKQLRWVYRQFHNNQDVHPCYLPFRINPISGRVYRRNDDCGRDYDEALVIDRTSYIQKGTLIKSPPRKVRLCPRTDWTPPENSNLIWQAPTPKHKDICKILSHHANEAKSDPEHLTTDFLKSLIFKNEDKCQEIT